MRVTRRWLMVAAIGCALVVLPMIVVAAVLIDKSRFGGLAGSQFLQIVTAAVMLGAILLLVGAWNLPGRTSWRGIVLYAWALIALTSPLFGIMFLLPWGLLVLTLPIVISALRAQWSLMNGPPQRRPRE